MVRQTLEVLALKLMKFWSKKKFWSKSLLSHQFCTRNKKIYFPETIFLRQHKTCKKELDKDHNEILFEEIREKYSKAKSTVATFTRVIHFSQNVCVVQCHWVCINKVFLFRIKGQSQDYGNSYLKTWLCFKKGLNKTVKQWVIFQIAQSDMNWSCAGNVHFYSEE